MQITDPDGSADGWIRACYPLTAPQTCDGAFVVNEPLGGQSWYPSNNYPTDKATFDTRITVPGSKTALGVGELASRKANRDGTTTWRWTEDDPTATYLTTATVGDFDLAVGTMRETSTRRNLPVYNAIDSSATPAQKAAIQASLDRAPDQMNFLSNLFGRYPFDSTGAVADRAAGVGYALEVQTKPHYSGGFTSGNPSINIGTQAHELAHQWVGNSVTLQTWSDIWFNEGWANWAEWWWQFKRERRRRPGRHVRRPLREHPGRGVGDRARRPGRRPHQHVRVLPDLRPGRDDGAGLPRDRRGQASSSGSPRTSLAGSSTTTSRPGSSSRSRWQRSGLRSADRALLRDYFEQWLYGETRPTILPESFD